MQLQLEQVVARHPAARREVTALGGLSLRIGEREQLAVIGPSGAGKTTLLHVMAAALQADSGTVRLDGIDPWRIRAAALKRLRGRLFLAPQAPPLPPRQRVVTAVLAGRLPTQGFWASLRSLLYPSDIAAAQAALERFDLGDKLFERVDRLSGGERQRIGLSRALLTPASLWLIDEPLSSLDPNRAELALRALIGEAQRRGVTLVATLHQVDTALKHFPRIVGLRDGMLAFDLPARQVKREDLQRLYAQHEDELHGGAAPPPPRHEAPEATPRVVHCR